jgi:hypothetical protein
MTPKEAMEMIARMPDGPRKAAAIAQMRTPVRTPEVRKSPAPLNPVARMFITGSLQHLFVDGWHPAPLNKIMAGHWSNGSKLKKLDREMIASHFHKSRLQSAHQKRRVGIHIILKKGQRAMDPDSLFKSLLDSLVHCGLLIDDNRQGCQNGPVTFSRAEDDLWGTLIILEDV